MSKGNDALCEMVLPEIDKWLEQYTRLEQLAEERSWLRGVSVISATEVVTAGMALMRRVAGTGSEFVMPAERALAGYHPWNIAMVVPHVAGGLAALRDAVQSGYLVSLQELTHAEVFGDFLEMAGYLLEEQYKDPAAVLTGGVLEGHLRKLCVKHEIPTEVPDKRGVPRPKKAESMNADLGRKPVYSKLDQKSVTAWLDLRNDAAHGHYHKYTDSQVELMLQGVRDFLIRHPA